MKKKYILLILVVLLALSLTTAAFAKESGDTFEGVVVEDPEDVEDEACEFLFIETEDGIKEIVTPEEDFGCDFFVEFIFGETYVVVNGDWIITEENELAFRASSVEVVEEGEGGEGEEGEEGEEEGEGGWGRGGVYCAEGSERVHPIAQKIVDKYEGVALTWVKEMVCDGFGFGEVMLAIQTVLANQTPVDVEDGDEVDPENGDGCTPEDGGDCVDNSLGNAAEELLNWRKAGKGWGQIWKENRIVENETSDKPGLGKLNKTEKVKGPKEGKGQDKGEDHPSNKVHPNNKNKNKNKNSDEDD
jgi:hypothetical protein